MPRSARVERMATRISTPRALSGRKQARRACRGGLLSHPERELTARTLRHVHRVFLLAGDKEPRRLHPVDGGAIGRGAAGRGFPRVVNLASRGGLL